MVDEGGGAWISQIILYIEDRALLFLSKKTIKSLIETLIWFTWLGCVLVRLRLVDCALMISWFATDSRQNANLPSLFVLKGILEYMIMIYWNITWIKNIWKILQIFPQFNQSINQYVFQDFLQGYCWQVIWFITVNNPRTDIGKPVFMTDLQMHWYKLCDDNLEDNDTIFGESNYNI